MIKTTALFITLLISVNVLAKSIIQSIDSALCIKDEIDCSEVKYLKSGEPSSYQDEKWDACCSRIFLQELVPNGMVVVFGGSRLEESSKPYRLMRNFAKKWTEQDKKQQWPIASGAGNGLMEAANRGAREAYNGNGRTIGLFTYLMIDGNLPKMNAYVTKEHSFIYRNFEKRESALIDNAKAVVIGLGGVGTEWEIMETLAKIKTGRKEEVPIILMGSKAQWDSLIKRLFFFMQNKTFGKDDCKLLNRTNFPSKAIQLILMSKEERSLDLTSVCKSEVWMQNIG